jgi:hypothetical protein
VLPGQKCGWVAKAGLTSPVEASARRLPSRHTKKISLCFEFWGRVHLQQDLNAPASAAALEQS